MKRLMAVLITALWMAASCPAQEEKPQEKPPERSSTRVEVPGPLYRMGVNVNEMDGTNKVNGRAYTLMVRARGSNQGMRENGYLRVGSRVPVQTGKESGVQYMDVGMKVDIADAREVEGLLMGTMSIEMNTVVPGEVAQTGNPVLRDLRLVSPFTLSAGKATVIGTVDDVNSKRTFQIEVTATKLR